MRDLDRDTAKMVEILLDKRSSYHKKLEYIKNELEESVRDVEFNYVVHGFFEDTCYAIHRAVSSLTGFTKMNSKSNPSGENPPSMIDVRFADGKRIKVPYGKINLPSFGESAYINMSYNVTQNTLHVEGVCQKRYTVLMDEIIESAIKIVEEDSIYKNKAVKYNGEGSPEFIDLTGVLETPIFLTPEAKYATEPIEVRITQPELCKEQNIDLKFGVLLEGNYGTGKTLYANKLALKAIDNGWTFLYCSKPENALKVLEVANSFTKNGTGVVLFIEDIDKILGKRDNVTNKISLLMDGSESKHNNLISVFTTNHIENIEPTFLRGKRIGSIVTLGALDASTATQMIEHSLGDTLTGSCMEAAKMIEEAQIVPAFVAEIIDRVKTHALLRPNNKVNEQDLINAIRQFKRQMDIATVKTQVESPEDTYIRLHKELPLNAIKRDPLFRSLWDYLEDQDYLAHSVRTSNLQ